MAAQYIDSLWEPMFRRLPALVPSCTTPPIMVHFAVSVYFFLYPLWLQITYFWVLQIVAGYEYGLPHGNIPLLVLLRSILLIFCDIYGQMHKAGYRIVKTHLMLGNIISAILLYCDLYGTRKFCANFFDLVRGGTGVVNDFCVLGLFPIENVWK